MEKVCHMTCVHKPNDDRIVLKECSSLVRAGYEVSIVFLGEVDEIINSKINYISAGSYYTSRKYRMLKGSYKVFRYAKKINADIYHFHDPEMIFWGLILKLLGKKVIYDVHEDLPKQIMSKKWVPKLIRGPVALVTKIIEFIAGVLFDAVVVVLPSIQRRFSRGKCICIYNYPLKDELFSGTDWNLRKPVFGYAGGLTKIRCIEEMIAAAKKTQYKLYLAGVFEDCSIAESVQQEKIVEYKGCLSREKVKKFYSDICCGLVLFYPEPNHLEAQPAKMKEYMSAGIPFIASNFPKWIEFVEKYKCGVCVDPLNVKEIGAAMDWIIRHPREAKKMGENGRRAIEEDFSWDSEEIKLLNIYKEILN